MNPLVTISPAMLRGGSHLPFLRSRYHSDTEVSHTWGTLGYVSGQGPTQLRSHAANAAAIPRCDCGFPVSTCHPVPAFISSDTAPLEHKWQAPNNDVRLP